MSKPLTKDEAGTRITKDGVAFQIKFSEEQPEYLFHLSRDDDNNLYVNEEEIVKIVGCTTGMLWRHAASYDSTDMYGSTLMESATPDGGVSVIKIRTVNVGLVLQWMVYESSYNASEQTRLACRTFIAQMAAFHFGDLYLRMRDEALSSRP